MYVPSSLLSVAAMYWYRSLSTLSISGMLAGPGMQRR
jgi:hypothetical protein